MNNSIHNQINEQAKREANLWATIDILQKALTRALAGMEGSKVSSVVSPDTKKAMEARQPAGSTVEAGRISRVFFDSEETIVGVEYSSASLNRAQVFGLPEDHSRVAKVETR